MRLSPTQICRKKGTRHYAKGYFILDIGKVFEDEDLENWKIGIQEGCPLSGGVWRHVGGEYCKTLPSNLLEADCSIFTRLSVVVVTFCHH